MKTLLISILFASGLMVLHSAPQSDLWEYWDKSNDGDTRTIDHGEFQFILDTYRNKGSESEVAKVNYASISQQDKQRLVQYIQGLSHLDILGYNRDEQFAYWVNLYNALTINLILENYPVKSIRKISKPWDQKIVTIDALDLSLNDIEHRILRPRWKDPRIHFAVNCASIGCPDLPSLAMTGENSEQILTRSMEIYLNHPRGLTFQRGKLYLSSIFDWYSVDFGDDEQAVIEFISRYYDFREIESAAGKSVYDLKVKYSYDWDLNEN